MNITIDSTYTRQTLTDLVQINSVNPELSPDGAGETAVAVYIAAALRDMGLEVTTYELGPQRMNVVGVLKGTGHGRSLLLNGHMDTVGVGGMADPFGATVRDGRLYGRGAQDMKGSLAAMMAAVKALVDGGSKLGGDVVLTAVADEEFESIGTADLVRHVTADAAIVTEPTDMGLCRAHRGFIWYEVVVTGRAAHGSRYKEGVDAITHMGRFLVELEKLGQELLQRPPHPLAGPPSIHASLVQGGSELSVYPARCTLKLERRTIPGETVAQATAELQAIIDRLAAADPAFRATVRPFFDRDPFEVSADAAIVQALEQAGTAVLGQPPAHTGATFWTDAALLAGAGIDTVLIGPVGAGLHSDEEWVEVQSVLELAQILAETAVAFSR
ncbi:MAG: ArgE/DapE family deacylase [Ardenticatenaceae bacterium]|nr:ArgE/DapE family deacylase [Ardenticatenaceae bacterium]